MKKVLIIILLVTFPIICQNYVNIKYTNETYKYAQLDDVSEITFDAGGTKMTVTLDGSSTIEDLASIIEMTFDAGILGEGSPLPVELVSFSAGVIENSKQVKLSWTTATEVDNYGFQVEHKTSNKGSFEKIGFVDGHGNSNSPKNYFYIDDFSFLADKVMNRSIEYRLKQIDSDGSFTYSNVISIELGIPNQYELKQNYPNPFNPTTNIDYKLPVDGFVTMNVYNLLGELVTTLVNENKTAGVYSIEFNGNNLPSGIYFCMLNAGDYSALIKMSMIK